MKKNAEQRIEDLKKVVEELIEAQLQFAGYHDAEGNYVGSPLQNPGVDPKIAERLLALACALDPLRGQLNDV
jgi:hypothetical protein